MNNYSASFLSIINPAYRGDSAETDFLKSVVKRRLIDFLPSAHDVTEIFIEDDNSVSGIVLSNDLKLYSFYLKDGLPPKIHVLRKSPGDGLAEGIESGFKPEESYPVAYSFDAESGDSKNIQKAKFLVGRVINPRLNGIKGIPYLKLDLDLLKGVAIAKDDRAYEFSLSRDGFYSYKLIDSTAKQDSDEKDDCKKGIPCGNACVPRGSECEGLLDPGSNAIVRLAFSTLERSEVPSRKEIVSAVAKETIPAIKEFIKDPKGSIERGNQREAMVRQMLEIASGARVPSRAEVAAEGMKKVDEAIEKTKDEARKFVVENEQNINNWIVNIGEAGGGAIGGALVAGPVGAIGGAVAGTLSTRAALSVVKSAKQVRERLSDDEAFRSATKLKKISMAASATISDLKDRTNEISDNVSEDISGYIIGTSIATASSVIPGISSIPFRGMIPAMIGSAGVSAAQSSLRGKQGASQAKSAAIAAMKEQASGVSKIAKKVTAAFTSIVDEGNKREAEMRKRINSRLLDSKKQLSAIK